MNSTAIGKANERRESMAINGQNKGALLQVSTGEDEFMARLTDQFPDAVAAAHRRIAEVKPSAVSLIARFTPEELAEDRSDEMAIVGKLKK
jgi:hypothetical protein